MKNRKCNLYITGDIAIIGNIGLVILQLRCYELKAYTEGQSRQMGK